MKIWVTRHGQTNLNKNRLMQGLTDEPLNAHGIAQAEAARMRIQNVTFDAVYASPLDRAIHTASIIGNVDRKDVIIDPRIIETDFGRYEQSKYYLMGPAMTLYWAWPEVMPAPKTVESISSMVKRSSEFLKELEQKGYENVLVACHGGIIRALCGYLEDRPNGIKWRPKPHNCEIRVYEYLDGKHRYIGSFGGDIEPPEELKSLSADSRSMPAAPEEVVVMEKIEEESAAKETAEVEIPVENAAEPEKTEPERLCACCGAPIEEKYAICDVCGWEDDPVQNREPDYAGGANLECLNEYRQMYLEKKAKEEAGK